MPLKFNSWNELTINSVNGQSLFWTNFQTNKCLLIQHSLGKPLIVRFPYISCHAVLSRLKIHWTKTHIQLKVVFLIKSHRYICFIYYILITHVQLHSATIHHCWIISFLWQRHCCHCSSHPAVLTQNLSNGCEWPGQILVLSSMKGSAKDLWKLDVNSSDPIW